MTSQSMSNRSECNQADKQLSLSWLGKVVLMGMAAVGSVGLGALGAVAQTPDFPDLPILEPAMPISAPVTVPPINARPVEPVAQPVAQPIPIVEPVPVFEAMDETVVIPVVSEVAPPELEQPIADTPVEEIAEPLAVEADAIPIEVTATEQSPTDSLNAGLPNSDLEPVVAEVVISNDTDSAIVSRWPAPIPFGQPLP